MTVMGKILVFLNLAVALLVGAFLLLDVATRTNWKIAADQAQQEVVAARASSASLKLTSLDIKSQLDKLTGERDALQKKLDLRTADYEQKLADKDALLAKQEEQARNSRIVQEASKAEASRLSEEVKMAQKTVSDRDTTILALEARSKGLLDRAVSGEQQRDTFKQRNEYLLTQLEISNKKLVKLEAGGASGGTLTKNPNAKNPPTVFVKGIVTNVLRDKGLVEISLGSDQGVNEGNTMEVYRLRPKPEYLGSIKILEAYHTKAVGRVMKSEETGRHSPVVKGDEVASKIMAR